MTKKQPDDSIYMAPEINFVVITCELFATERPEDGWRPFVCITADMIAADLSIKTFIRNESGNGDLLYRNFRASHNVTMDKFNGLHS